MLTAPTMSIYVVSLLFQEDGKAVHVINAIVAESPGQAAALVSTLYVQQSEIKWPLTSVAVEVLSTEFVSRALSETRAKPAEVIVLRGVPADSA